MKECLAFDDVRIEPQFLSTKTSRLSVDPSTQIGRIKLKVPMISSPMTMVGESKFIIALEKLGGLGMVHRFMDVNDQKFHLTKIAEQGLPGVVAIGIAEQGRERFKSLLEVRSTFQSVCIDVANGYSLLMKEMIDFVKQETHGEVDVIAGNIASIEGYEFLAENKADAVRFGIGSGSRCITAIQTGINKPLFSTILECKEVHKEKYPHVAIIGDGGIRYPSDLVLSIAAGADAIIAGGIFAGCDESSAAIVNHNGILMKEYYGMASFEHQQRYYGKIKSGIAAEGISYPVPLSGPIENTIVNFVGGLKSAMTYLDAETLAELRQNARFIRITNSALIESHSVNTRK